MQDQDLICDVFPGNRGLDPGELHHRRPVNRRPFEHLFRFLADQVVVAFSHDAFESLIGQNDPAAGIKHQKAFRQVIQRSCEPVWGPFSRGSTASTCDRDRSGTK